MQRCEHYLAITHSFAETKDVELKSASEWEQGVLLISGSTPLRGEGNVNDYVFGSVQGYRRGGQVTQGMKIRCSKILWLVSLEFASERRNLSVYLTCG